MNTEELRDCCLAMKGVEENMPFLPKYDMLVTFTVGSKWFCLLNLDTKSINVKCSPERVTEMQARYAGACPAWHMNKKHWLGVELESDVPDDVIAGLLAEGYRLVMGHLPKAMREVFAP